MFGCIPIISETSSIYYSALFAGTLFPQDRRPIDEIAVVIEDKYMFDADAVMQIINKITPSEIACRQERLKMLAPFLQWGHAADGHGHDAFDLLIASFMHVPSKSEI